MRVATHFLCGKLGGLGTMFPTNSRLHMIAVSSSTEKSTPASEIVHPEHCEESHGRLHPCMVGTVLFTNLHLPKVSFWFKSPHLAAGQKSVPKMEPWYLRSPGALTLTHTHLSKWKLVPPPYTSHAWHSQSLVFFLKHDQPHCRSPGSGG